MKLYFVNINEKITGEQYQYLLSIVSEEKRNRIKQFHYTDDAKRGLYSDVLVRHIACKKFATANNILTFSVGRYGKPFLVGYPNFQYNISHSEEWIVCAVSDSKIGIDIEQTKPINFDIAKRFFTEYEYSELMRQPQNEQLGHFYKIWTLKESYIKCIGEGLRCPLNSFEFQIEEDHILFTTEYNEKFYFKQFGFNEYELAVCSVKQATSFEIHRIDLSDMCI